MEFVVTSNDDLQKFARNLWIRDVQLWSIALTVMLVLASGIVFLVLPSGGSPLNVHIRYIPQLVSGLIALVLLLNMYLIERRRELDRSRNRLFRELSSSAEVLDPLTQVFRRACLDELLKREIARANRDGSSITFLVARHDPLRLLVARHGRTPAELLVVEIAQVIKKTFRGSDLIVRYSDSEFLVVMPETTNEQAKRPCDRLQESVDRWNLWHNSPSEMWLTLDTAEYRTGMDANLIIDGLAPDSEPGPFIKNVPEVYAGMRL